MSINHLQQFPLYGGGGNGGGGASLANVQVI